MPQLRLEGLTNTVLQGVSLHVVAGQIVCLSGASGSGKSCLLRALADLDAHQGQVWLDELEQQQCPAHQWRQRVRGVPAESQWWFDRVSDHFPADYDPQPFQAVGLPEAALSWQVSRLSSGEKQRLALLRALAYPLEVLLLDEPTANLDATTALAVEQWLVAQIRQQAWPTLWVSHDPEQIQRVADAHWRMDAGQLKEVRHGRD